MGIAGKRVLSVCLCVTSILGILILDIEDKPHGFCTMQSKLCGIQKLSLRMLLVCSLVSLVEKRSIVFSSSSLALLVFPSIACIVIFDARNACMMTCLVSPNTY